METWNPLPQIARLAGIRIAAILLCLAPMFSFGGALENYMAKEDSSFAWKKQKQTSAAGGTVTQLELTSQKWREGVWRHSLQVYRPEKVRNPHIAFLLVSGDGNGERYLGLLKAVAESGGAIAAILNNVPNQPLYDGKKEDALIAHTFDQYLKTGDETWPLLFPMVKSAVRAMDAIQQFAEKEHGQTVQSYVVSGASKRGWTTWLSAAADKRVKGIAPMVIDMLNIPAQAEWAEKVYGRQSEMINDYTRLNLIMRMEEPAGVKLRSMVDPYSYRERYNIPKLILLGTNDPYWTVDSLRHYWDDLPGPKLIFQTPNAGHNLNGGREATPALAAFFQMIADGKDLPKMDWQFSQKDKQARIDVSVNQQAKAIRLWTAESKDRDFRNDKWTSRQLEIKPGSSKASAEIPTPTSGYKAYLVEATLTAPNGQEYQLSTEARVTPDGIRK